MEKESSLNDRLPLSRRPVAGLGRVGVPGWKSQNVTAARLLGAIIAQSPLS